jgi:multiple sugar transport system permease protein
MYRHAHATWVPALGLPRPRRGGDGRGLPVPAAVGLQLGFFDWSMGTPWSEARWVGLDAFVAAFNDAAVWRSLSPR